MSKIARQYPPPLSKVSPTQNSLHHPSPNSLPRGEGELPGRQEFIQYFDQTLQPHYQRFQEVRAELLANIKRKSLLPLALFLSAWLLSFHWTQASAIIQVFAYLSVFYLIPKRQTIAEIWGWRSAGLKEQVYGQFVSFLSPNLHYQSSIPFPYDEFYTSGLFETRADMNSIEDVIHGHIYDTNFTCGEITTADIKVSRDSKGRSTTRRIIRFRGLFFAITFDKSFHGHTTVRTDHAEKHFGFVGRGFQRIKSGDNLVELEDPEFESHFIVRSTDQVEARYLLSTSFMRKILELREKVGPQFQLAFRDSKLILAIPNDKNLFEINFYQREQWKQSALKLYDEIMMVLDIIWEIRSNRQLWPKEEIA